MREHVMTYPAAKQSGSHRTHCLGDPIWGADLIVTDMKSRQPAPPEEAVNLNSVGPF